MKFHALIVAMMLTSASFAYAGSDWKVRGKEQCTSWSFNITWSSQKHKSREDCDDKPNGASKASTEKCENLRELLECLSKRWSSFKWRSWKNENCDEYDSPETCEQFAWEEDCEDDYWSADNCDESTETDEQCEDTSDVWVNDCVDVSSSKPENGKPERCTEDQAASLATGKSKGKHRSRWAKTTADCEQHEEQPAPAAAIVESATEADPPMEIEPTAKINMRNVAKVGAPDGADQIELTTTRGTDTSIEATDEPRAELTVTLAAPAASVEVLVAAVQHASEPVEEPLVLVFSQGEIAAVAPAVPVETVADVLPAPSTVPTAATAVIAAVPEPSAALLGLLAVCIGLAGRNGCRS